MSNAPLCKNLCRSHDVMRRSHIGIKKQTKAWQRTARFLIKWRTVRNRMHRANSLPPTHKHKHTHTHTHTFPQNCMIQVHFTLVRTYSGKTETLIPFTCKKLFLEQKLPCHSCLKYSEWDPRPSWLPEPASPSVRRRLHLKAAGFRSHHWLKSSFSLLAARYGRFSAINPRSRPCFCFLLLSLIRWARRSHGLPRQDLINFSFQSFYLMPHTKQPKRCPMSFKLNQVRSENGTKKWNFQGVSGVQRQFFDNSWSSE